MNGERRNGSDMEPRSQQPQPTADKIALWFKVIASAWALSVLLAVFDEFSAVPHGPLVLAAAFSALLAMVVMSQFRLRQAELQAASPDDDYEKDPLTGLMTPEGFNRRFEEESHRVDRYGGVFSLILAESNNLAELRREYGKPGYDEALRHVAHCIDRTKRLSDISSYLGEGEFGVVLQCCDDRGAKAFVERLEESLARQSATVEIGGRKVSLWVGVCAGIAVSQRREGPQQMAARAAGNLKAAKEERDKRRRLWITSA